MPRRLKNAFLTFSARKLFLPNFWGAFRKNPLSAKGHFAKLYVLHFVSLDLQLWLGHSSNVSQNELHDSY